jgi:hypothetical protein
MGYILPHCSMILKKKSVKENIGSCPFMIEVSKAFDNLIIFIKKVVHFTADIVIFA